MQVRKRAQRRTKGRKKECTRAQKSEQIATALSSKTSTLREEEGGEEEESGEEEEEEEE